jgi:hypothetical protein
MPDLAVVNTEIQLRPDDVKMLLAGHDVAGMSQDEQYQFACILYADMQKSVDSTKIQPVRYKINKDACVFTDPFGNSHDQLVGVIIARQAVRGFWEEGNKIPLCSSLNCVTGRTRADEHGNRRTWSCAGCKCDEWGSATEGDKKRKGKACKEMRRVTLMTEDAILPIQISLPPSSLKAFDQYIRDRLSVKVSDLTAEAVFTLVPESGGGFSYAVIKPKLGRRLKPLEILKYAKIQQQFEAALKTQEVTADDYDATKESAATKDAAPPVGDVDVPPVGEVNDDGLHPKDPVNLI